MKYASMCFWTFFRVGGLILEKTLHYNAQYCPEPTKQLSILFWMSTEKFDRVMRTAYLQTGQNVSHPQSEVHICDIWLPLINHKAQPAHSFGAACMEDHLRVGALNIPQEKHGIHSRPYQQSCTCFCCMECTIMITVGALYMKKLSPLYTKSNG